MSFEWNQFLKLAQALGGEPSSEDGSLYAHEAALRSAVSRAYYAAFHTAKIHVRDRDPTRLKGNGTDHEEVPRWLKDVGRSATEKGAAAKLEKLKRLRKWADYESSEKKRLEDDVKQALRDAAAVVTNLGSSDKRS